MQDSFQNIIPINLNTDGEPLAIVTVTATNSDISISYSTTPDALYIYYSTTRAFNFFLSVNVQGKNMAYAEITAFPGIAFLFTPISLVTRVSRSCELQ